jgi:WhiB family redox-sensing transcriptional regulator
MIWQDSAACAEVDGDLFFPESVPSSASLLALALCRTCPVTVECLRVAMTEGIDVGIWGGLTSVQRKKLRKGLAS